MKELLGHSSNLLLSPVLEAPPEVSARVELILICSEPEYDYDAGGLKRSRVVSSFRVLTGHKALRDMALKLVELADEAEDLERTMNRAVADEMPE